MGMGTTMKAHSNYKTRTLLFILLLMMSVNIFSQSFSTMTPGEQGLFYQGYWKYYNPDSDELFIVKIKALERVAPSTIIPEAPYSFIGSYLYMKNNLVVSNNLSDLDTCILFSTNMEYYTLLRQPNYHTSMALFGSMKATQDQAVADLWFYDHTKHHSNGKVTLSVVSIETRNEQIRWNLRLQDGVSIILEDDESALSDEEVNNRYLRFSVPTDMILTKMYNLREFRSKGIILEPIPELHQ